VRFHNGLFYVYFPTPDESVFVSTAPKMTGPWSKPQAVLVGPDYEDPCPFWDDDGQAYLVHSKVGAGPLILHRMSPDGMKVLDDGKEIVRDAEDLPGLEGPKVYKRNGWFYIFAPYGGVPVGAQAVLNAGLIIATCVNAGICDRGTCPVDPKSACSSGVMARRWSLRTPATIRM
jgi:beta-xylosidase